MVFASDSSSSEKSSYVAIIGGGPAGLMAAEVLSNAGISVTVYEALPSVGRKFLLAGRGGLNLTHSEPEEYFISRYGNRQKQIAPLLTRFSPAMLRTWADTLGADTFIGSSGRVFPSAMKAAPLLRAWLYRLRQQGVQFAVRHRWQGWTDNRALRFQTPAGEIIRQPVATLLALGGGSWEKFGGGNTWVPLLRAQGIHVTDLLPTNCGFHCAEDWSPLFQQRYIGHPVKTTRASLKTPTGEIITRAGECVITEHGFEGGLIYALSAPIRDTIIQQGKAVLHLDLTPDISMSDLEIRLNRPRGSRSFGTYLQAQTGLKGVKAGLLYEFAPKTDLTSPSRLAQAIKALPVPLASPRPIDEAISTAGGVSFDDLDESLMIRTHPGLFCAGEMLDWEAPTGGYLLSACFASGHVAGQGVIQWIKHLPPTV